jgi:hypothetical protein
LHSPQQLFCRFHILLELRILLMRNLRRSVSAGRLLLLQHFLLIVQLLHDLRLLLHDQRSTVQLLLFLLHSFTLLLNSQLLSLERMQSFTLMLHSFTLPLLQLLRCLLLSEHGLALMDLDFMDLDLAKLRMSPSGDRQPVGASTGNVEFRWSVPSLRTRTVAL